MFYVHLLNCCPIFAYYSEHLVDSGTKCSKTNPQEAGLTSHVMFVFRNAHFGDQKREGVVLPSQGMVCFSKIPPGDLQGGVGLYFFPPRKLGSTGLGAQEIAGVKAWSAELALRKLRSAAWRLQELASFSAVSTAPENWACLNACVWSVAYMCLYGYSARTFLGLFPRQGR